MGRKTDRLRAYLPFSSRKKNNSGSDQSAVTPISASSSHNSILATHPAYSTQTNSALQAPSRPQNAAYGQVKGTQTQATNDVDTTTNVTASTSLQPVTDTIPAIDSTAFDTASDQAIVPGPDSYVSHATTTPVDVRAIENSVTSPSLPQHDGSRLSPKTTRTLQEKDGKRLRESEVHTPDLDARHARSPSLVRIVRTETDPMVPESAGSQALGVPAGTTTYDGGRGGRGGMIMVPLETTPQRRSPKSSIYHNDEDVMEGIFPKTIKCFLMVTFNEAKKFEEIEHTFKWYKCDTYVEIKNNIKKIRDRFEEEGFTEKTQKIYLRYASCFVKGDRNHSALNPDDHILIDDEETLADVAIQTVCGFIRDYPYQPFVLKINCDYSSVDRNLVDEETGAWPSDKPYFVHAISDAYKEKMTLGRPSILLQRYLSLADQQVLVTPNIACRVVDEDAFSVPKLEPEQKQKLKDEILARTATVLTAVCIYDHIPMRFLYHLLCEDPHAAKRYSDKLETLSLHDFETCQNPICKKQKALLENIHKFFPEIIKADAEHSAKSDQAVVPVRYVKDEQGRNVVLGSGAFGTVYEVDIDPHHQLLTPVSFARLRYFPVKLTA